MKTHLWWIPCHCSFLLVCQSPLCSLLEVLILLAPKQQGSSVFCTESFFLNYSIRSSWWSSVHVLPPNWWFPNLISVTVSFCKYLFLNAPQESQWTCHISPKLPLACVNFPVRWLSDLLNPFACNWEVHLENNGPRAVSFQIRSRPYLHYMLSSLLPVNIILTQDDDLILPAVTSACLLP